MTPGDAVMLDRVLKVVLVKTLADTEQAVIEFGGATSVVPLASLSAAE